MDAMAAIKQTFFQECEEQLVELEAGLLAMDEGHADSETVNAVFRSVHSIKGGAGAFKLSDLVQFSHAFETSLDRIRSGRLAASPDVMKVMLRAADVLADLVRAARDGIETPEAAWKSIAAELNAVCDAECHGPDTAPGTDDGMGELDFQPVALCLPDFEGGSEGAADDRREYCIRFKPRPELYGKANDPILILRELARLGEATVHCDTREVPFLDALDPAAAHLAWTIELKTASDEAAVREVFEFVDGDCELDMQCTSAPVPSQHDVEALMRNALADVAAARPTRGEHDEPTATTEPALMHPPHTAAGHIEHADAAAKQKGDSAAAQATIRVDLDRVDRLINLVGELVINRAMLSQRITETGMTGAAAVTMGLGELEQLTREIQDSVMAIRAQPVKPLFQRMSRIVREVADATGKKVRLKTEGEATEVDKTVIERLVDPLTHMIRNAVDHGLESPEVRAAAGKPAEGSVRLAAAHRSGRIVIEVADDGAGINRPRVRETAIRKGLIAPDAQLSDSEIDNLLFLPGFSTASEVSNISGRGVGMDVVKRSIQALGGRISISSRPGEGTVFSMSLPLTLAVLDGMVVSVDGRTLVVPLTAIVETMQPKAAHVHALGMGSRVISIRNRFIPLIDVACELGYRSTPTDPASGVAILVETERGEGHALLVDRIQDQRQVVIKSLETNYGHVEGIAAATILGDGRVALILDVDAIVVRSNAGLSLSEPLLAAAG
jgi:two-component system chemotaxis sensor kinase CheA